MHAIACRVSSVDLTFCTRPVFRMRGYSHETIRIKSKCWFDVFRFRTRRDEREGFTLFNTVRLWIFSLHDCFTFLGKLISISLSVRTETRLHISICQLVELVELIEFVEIVTIHVLKHLGCSNRVSLSWEFCPHFVWTWGILWRQKNVNDWKTQQKFPLIPKW